MLSLLLALLLSAPALPVLQAAEKVKQEHTMTEARGSFTVEMHPRSAAPAEGLAAMTLTKIYTGQLQATAAGELLSAGDPGTGNAGYFAIERITGHLGSRTGTFALMQSGLMSTGTTPQMTVTIVPGSGTGDLSGLYGSMTITNDGGKHTYVLRYSFST